MDSLPFESFNVRTTAFSAENAVLPSTSEVFITDEPPPLSLLVPRPNAPALEPDLPREPTTVLTRIQPVEQWENEYQDAVALLMQQTNIYDLSLYGHISAMVRQLYYAGGDGSLWRNSPSLLSRIVKRHNLPPVAMHYVKSGYIAPTELPIFSKLRGQLVAIDDDQQKKVDYNGPLPQGIGYLSADLQVGTVPPSPVRTAADDEDGEDMEQPPAYIPFDSYEWLFYAQEGGIGFSKGEVYLATAAVLRFQKKYYNDLVSLRFWGRMEGSVRPYYIIECEFKDASDKWYETPAVLITPEHTAHKATLYNPFGTYGVRQDYGPKKFSLDETRFPVPAVPKIDPDQTFKEIQPEEIRTGANLYCYYVCSELLAADWHRLPDVNPDQIRKARFVRRGLTGNLEAKISVCPTFPGREKHYLRAQIARISHNCYIGPIGEFLESEDEEDLAEGAVSPNFRLLHAPDFEHPNLRDVLSKNLSGYGHNLPFLLRQGRCSFFDPSPGIANSEAEAEGEQREEEESEEDLGESEEGNEKERIKKKKLRAKQETGPAVFSPISDDREIGKDMPAWVVKTSSSVLPQNGVVKICSNLWPGAVCLVQTKKSECFYSGNGLKYGEFTPYFPPIPQITFNPNMKLLQHAKDPTVAVEEEQRKSKEALEKARQEALDAEAAENEDKEEEETEGEEGEEEEETEDDK